MIKYIYLKVYVIIITFILLQSSFVFVVASDIKDVNLQLLNNPQWFNAGREVATLFGSLKVIPKRPSKYSRLMISQKCGELVNMLGIDGDDLYSDALKLNDYIINNVQYLNTETKEEIENLYKSKPEAFEITGVLFDKEGTCEGISKTIYLILSKSGYDVKVVPVYKENSNHVYVIIKQKGVEYKLDVVVNYQIPYAEFLTSECNKLDYFYVNKLVVTPQNVDEVLSKHPKVFKMWDISSEEVYNKLKLYYPNFKGSQYKDVMYIEED